MNYVGNNKQFYTKWPFRPCPQKGTKCAKTQEGALMMRPTRTKWKIVTRKKVKGKQVGYKHNHAAAHVEIKIDGYSIGDWLIPTSSSANNKRDMIWHPLRDTVTGIKIYCPGLRNTRGKRCRPFRAPP